MIIQCDKCGAKFHLDDGKVSDKGAKVRCSKCKAIFTVKRPKEQPAEPPPAPPGNAPQPRAAGQGSEGDPFSDFNFNDDLDFGEEPEEDLTVGAPAEPPPAPPGDAGFELDDSEPEPPPPTTPRDFAAPVQEEAGVSNDAFDFPDDEGFSLSDAPAAPAQAEPEQAAPPPPAAADEFGNIDISSTPAPAVNSDDFDDDFKFDDDSFTDGEAPAAKQKSPPPPPDGEWGNLSLGAEGGPAAGGAGAGGMDTAEYGDDFRFDQSDTLPSSGGIDEDMVVDDFVRSPTSRAPVTDDLEASIGDSEPEPPAQRENRPDAAPLPPKPVIKREVKKSGGKPIILIIVLVLLIGAMAGFVVYTNSKGYFTFSDLAHFRFAKIGDVPAINDFLISQGWKEEPDTGVVEVMEYKTDNLVRDDGAIAIVVKGTVINKTRKNVKSILVEVSLDVGNTVLNGQSFCNVFFTEEELKTLSKESIQEKMSNSSGRDLKCLDVPSKEKRDFAIVFFPLFEGDEPVKVKLTKPQVIDYQTLGE